MRIFLLLVLVSVCALVNGQKIIHIDTSENRYVSPKGYRSPELMFKKKKECSVSPSIFNYQIAGSPVISKDRDRENMEEK